MKTLRIKYIPPMITGITVVLSFGLWLLPMCLSYNEKMADYALVGSLVGMAVMAVLQLGDRPCKDGELLLQCTASSCKRGYGIYP